MEGKGFSIGRRIYGRTFFFNLLVFVLFRSIFPHMATSCKLKPILQKFMNYSDKNKTTSAQLC